MRRLLDFDVRKRAYERPKDKWICGRAALGRPCRLGPGRLGGCRTRTACDPIFSQGAWVCTRPEHAGGKCEDGPGASGDCCLRERKCVPVRNLRNLRGRIAFWAFALTLGALAYTFAGGMREQIVHPGPVIQAHSEVAGCGACHAAFDGGAADWLVAAFDRPDPMADSAKCTRCHDKGKQALGAHSLSEAMLAGHTREARPPSTPSGAAAPLQTVSRAIFPVDRGADGLLACGACHKDHKGPRFDATFVPDNRCQSCHKYKFASLANGHPSFGAYPYLRRSRIAFDHHAHFKRHFPQAKAGARPKACADCHQPDPSERFMLVEPFEKACAACHGKDIEGTSLAGAKGIPVFTVPGLDTETLGRRGFGVGQWPKDAQADQISPFIRIILAGDRQLDADLRRIAGVDLQDLGGANKAVLAAVRRVAWGIKELLYDLGQSGGEAVQARLGSRLGTRLDREALGRLMGHLSLDVVRAAQARWFPRLEREVRGRRQRRASLDVIAPPSRAAWWPGASLTGPPVARIALAGPPDAAAMRLIDRIIAGAAARSPAPPPVRLAQRGGTLLTGDAKLIDRRSLRLDDYEQLLREDRKGNNSIFTRDRATGSLPTGKAVRAPERPARSTGRKSRKAERPAPAARHEADSVDPEEWARSGGWYRSEFTLYYRPVEHRDAFMRGWIDIATAAYATPAKPHGEALLAVFRSAEAVGRCLRCHSVDAGPGGGLAVNWRPFAPVPGEQAFTVFDHATHFSMVGDDGCQTCHRLNPKAKFEAAFTGFDAKTFEPGFAPLDREVCVECHVPKAAGDGCVQCHRYHIGVFPYPPVHTEIAHALRGASRSARASVRGHRAANVPVPRKRPEQPDDEAPSASTKVPAPRRKPGALASAATSRAAEVAPPPRKPALRSRARHRAGRYAIRLGAYLTERRAVRSKGKFRRWVPEFLDGQVLLVERVKLRGGRVIYRVVARPFRGKAEAGRACRRIAARGRIRCSVGR